MQLYRDHPIGSSFEENFATHLEHKDGYIFSTPEFFMLARAIRRDATREELADPRSEFSNPDCWFIWLCVGDWRQAILAAPNPMPWVGWARRDRLRFWKWDDLLRLAIPKY